MKRPTGIGFRNPLWIVVWFFGTFSLAPVSPGEATETAAESPPAGPEAVDRRTVSSRHYDLGGGRYQARISAAPLHFLDDDGSWQEIDTELARDHEDRYTAKRNGLLVSLPPNYWGEVRTSRRGQQIEEVSLQVEEVGLTPTGVRWVMDGIAYDLKPVDEHGAAMLDGPSLSFGEIVRGIFATYSVQPNGLSHRITLTDGVHRSIPQAGGQLEVQILLDLPDGAVLRADGVEHERTFTTRTPVEVISRHGTPLLAITPPLALELGSHAEFTKGSLSVQPDTGGWDLTMAIPATWLTDPDRTFPIEVRSAVTIQPPTSDTLISPGLGIMGLFGQLWVGFDGSNPYRTLLQFFDLSAIPSQSLLDGTSDDDGRIRLYEVDHWGDGESQYIRAYRLLDTWDETAADWTHRGSSSLWATPGGDFFGLIGLGYVDTSSGYHSLVGLGIRDTVALWRTFYKAEPFYTYGLFPFGVLIKLPDPESGTDVKYFASKENAAPNSAPQLVVNYTDGPQVLADRTPRSRRVPSPDYFVTPDSNLWRAIGIRPTNVDTNYDLKLFKEDYFGLLAQQSTRGAGEIDLVVINQTVAQGPHYPFVFSPGTDTGDYWYEYAERTGYFGFGIAPQASFGPYTMSSTAIVRLWTFYESSGSEICASIEPFSGDTRLGAAIFGSATSYGNLSSALASNVADTDGGRVEVSATALSTGIFGLLVWSEGGSVEFFVNGCLEGLLFKDGFESGDTTRWSNTIP